MFYLSQHIIEYQGAETCALLTSGKEKKGEETESLSCSLCPWQRDASQYAHVVATLSGDGKDKDSENA